jgi:hypothetical protein
MKKALAILTYPGVILRESLRLLVCRMGGIAVFRARFFTSGVMHEKVSTSGAALALASVPLAASYVLAIALVLPVALAVHMGAQGWIEYGLLWLGLSLAVQGAPAEEDAQMARKLVRGGSILYGIHLLGLLLGILVPSVAAWAIAAFL